MPLVELTPTPFDYRKKARIYLPLDDGRWMEIAGHLPGMTMQRTYNPETDSFSEIKLELDIQRAEVRYIEENSLPSADNYADWERMILNGAQ